MGLPAENLPPGGGQVLKSVVCGEAYYMKEGSQ
jgi:hypothetical protein